MTSKRTATHGAAKGRLTRLPREQMAQAREGQLGWVLGACERVLRPLVRLALAFGVKHAQFERILRDVMLDEARRAWVAKGTEPNISQLSVTTGLNRKAITSRVRESTPLPYTEFSAEAKTLTLWLQMHADDPALGVLPITTADDSVPSFEGLAKLASRGNVHHRALLDELVRLNMATERDGTVELVVEGFVPEGDLKGMLSFLGDNARDHLLASVSNTIGARPPLLERAVFASGISIAECDRIHRLARERWKEFHREIYKEMRKAYAIAQPDDTTRIRVGIYAYFEDPKAELDSKGFTSANLEEGRNEDFPVAAQRPSVADARTPGVVRRRGRGKR